MNIKISKNINEFKNDYEDLLLKNEVSNQLIFLNANNIFGNFDEHQIFGSINDDNDNPLLIFANAYPFNLLLTSIKNNFEITKVLVDFILENKVLIRGINGNEEDTNLFIDVYEKISDRRFTLHTPMDVMAASEVIKVNIEEKGEFQNANMKDLDKIFSYYISFIQEINESLNVEKSKTNLIDRINDLRQYVYVVDGEIVSMAHAAKRTKNSISIAGVYTNPIYRGNNYCTFLMCHLTKKLLNEGNKYCTLFVDKTNPISNRVYKKVGYKVISENLDYRLI